MTVTRPALTLLTFAAVAAWASAQGPAPGRTAAQQLALFRANRPLLESLIDYAVKVSAAPDPVGRVDQCREAVAAVGRAVREAAEAEDTDRVAELGEHLSGLLADGLEPALRSAGDGVPPGSPSAEELAKVRAGTERELTQVLNALRFDGPLGRSAAVREVRAKLQAAADKLKPLAVADGENKAGD